MKTRMKMSGAGLAILVLVVVCLSQTAMLFTYQWNYNRVIDQRDQLMNISNDCVDGLQNCAGLLTNLTSQCESFLEAWKESQEVEKN